MLSCCGNSLSRKLLTSPSLRAKANTSIRTSKKSSLADTTTYKYMNRSIKANELNLEVLAANHGVRLTNREVKSLRSMLDTNQDGRVSIGKLQKAGKIALEKRWTRELFLQVVEQPTTASLQTTSKLLAVLDYGGTALFAVVGAQLAGEKDMNLIGCTLIGCIAAMGGGSFNNLLYGSSAQLLDKPGVFWVRSPQYLMIAVAVSMITFYTWPQYCRQAAKQKVEDAVGVKNICTDGSIRKRDFIRACENDPDIQASFAASFKTPLASPAELFEDADVDGTRKISSKEMQAIVAKQFSFGNSLTMYTIDTLAMAAFAVVGANGAVQRGLHPLVAATCGVSICFGSILRDLLCARDLAIGGQSYAFAMGAGSGVYVILRELRLRGFPFPLIARIVMAFSTTVNVRALEYVRGEPLLRPMHYRLGDEDSELLRRIGQNDPEGEWLGDVKRRLFFGKRS